MTMSPFAHKQRTLSLGLGFRLGIIGNTRDLTLSDYHEF